MVAVITLILLFALLLLRLYFWWRSSKSPITPALERGERIVREELLNARLESKSSARELREELQKAVLLLSGGVQSRVTDLAELQNRQLLGFGGQLEAMRGTITKSLFDLKTDSAQQQLAGRDELAKGLRSFAEALVSQLHRSAQEQQRQLDAFTESLNELTVRNERSLTSMRETMEHKLAQLDANNAAKLEEMRSTVDEKLHATLERRLGESFQLVSVRLEQVHSGLGEMRNLANGVGDLRKILSNVKTQGGWGEVQLGNLLEQMFTPDQYARNVATRPESSERVEYAIRLPGGEHRDGPLWLPIDAKFPQEAYRRLVEAQETLNPESVEAASLELDRTVEHEARKIASKYINPPQTTDFAVLFLPLEGLYAELLRRPGLVDRLQREHRVMLSGPTTLAALLTSLQMGFRTLAIQERSSEVWRVLGAVKTEFDKFGGVLDKVKKKLQEATNTIDEAGVRSRAMQRKLRGTEALPAGEAIDLLQLPASSECPDESDN